jgi:hypothetical protein
MQNTTKGSLNLRKPTSATVIVNQSVDDFSNMTELKKQHLDQNMLSETFIQKLSLVKSVGDLASLIKEANCFGLQQTFLEAIVYPVYMQSKLNKQVVKFTSMNEGVVVVKGDTNLGGPCPSVGFASEWVDYTNTDHWQPIPYAEHKGVN